MVLCVGVVDGSGLGRIPFCTLTTLDKVNYFLVSDPPGSQHPADDVLKLKISNLASPKILVYRDPPRLSGGNDTFPNCTALPQLH